MKKLIVSFDYLMLHKKQLAAAFTLGMGLLEAIQKSH